MRTMSDETERRICDEDFESDEGDEGEEGDVESYLGDVEEEDNSSELMDRLKELEAENSALLLANESQREAYERCLDEVANHVVQALLNQKDLREECIKLKMLVFDLERQNRALCELFQQKLPNHPTSQYQVQPGPLPDYNAQLHSDSAKQVEPQTEAQAKGNGYRTQHASPGPRGPATSMEALSPFFKKKAHILEVLRKMEETDPLKFHPSTAGLSVCDYSQVLISTEAVLAAGELQYKKTQHTHCRCSCCDGDAHQQHVNGDGGNACKKSPDGPSKCNHVCGPSSSSSAVTTATTASTAAISDCHAKSTGAECSLPSKQSHYNGQHHHPHQQKTCPDSRLLANDTESHRVSQRTGDGQVLKGSKVVKTELVVERDSVSITEGGGMRSSQLPVPVKDSPEAAPRETETGAPEHAGPVQSDNDATAMLDDIPEKDTTEDEAGSLRADASVSPGPSASCLSDVKVAAISSPSKLLKFLKIPSVGERSQAATSPVRLSPQLTRNSRIPCRTNNYEVYHSPVPSRRATTAERCRQPPPPPARSESYPATHSAPTSPPQSEDATSPPAKELGYSSLSSPISKACTGGVAKAASSSSAASSSPRSTRRVPHYENVSEVSRREESLVPEKRTTLPSQTKPGSGGERKLVKSLPESVLRPAPPQRQLSSPSASSSSSSSSSSDQEDQDSESLVWTDHHSLPSVSALHKAQSRERPAQETELRDSHPVSEAPPATQAPAPSRKNDPSSIPKRPGPGSGRSPAESSHHAFKERLAALGKLRGSEEAGSHPAGSADTHCSESGPKDEKSKTAERTLESHPEEQRHSSKHSDSMDSKPKGNSGLKYPSQAYEAAVKALPSGPGSSKPELCVTKTESPRSKIGLLSPNSDAPQVLRNNVKCPGSLNLPYNGKTSGLSPHVNTNSPNKVPPKSPSKPCQPPSSSSSSSRPGKPSDTPRYASKSEERSKIGGSKNKRNPAYGDSLPPPPPRPPTSDPSEEKVAAPAASPQSTIEQKVMKGIEENMLKLQEQDRGAPPPELKHKTSNGIASWFGLKKSKLPALSRKAEGSKGKDEKKEWKINIPSVGKDSKVAARCKEGVEGLNISTLMEKAEGLRRALEEERAYVERAGRGHSCEVVMDPAQGQLAVMYRGGRSDNFMQQLLNRVDGKEVISVPQRRLSFDCKSSRPVFSQQSDSLSHTTSREDMQKGSSVISNVTSDENLADPVHSQHFAGSGASTYTLDSGIGTFPLPDYSSGAAGRSLSKMRAGGVEHHASGSPGRVGHRARTLDREMGAQEESYQPHRQLIPTIQYGSAGGVIHEDKEAHGPQMFTPRSKTWTFPNLKTPAGASDPVYLAVEEEEENVPYVSPFRGQNVKPGGPSVSRVADPGSLPVPVQTGLSRRGKSRTPSVPEMNREAGLELLRERPEEALSPSRPQVLETPESLSDSLYDSLSSCGSQG